MKKKDTLLTIAIPTYNRAAYLERQLSRLKRQNDDRIEILVSDNGSDDNTAEVVSRYCKDMNNLFYSRNTENIGFDQNIMKLYFLARSKYIWFLSDDDPILEGAVCNILRFIDAHQPTVAILGLTYSENEASDWALGSKSVEVFESLGSIPDYSLFTRAIFMSAVIVRKGTEEINEARLSKLLGSQYFHLSLCLVLLSRRFKFYLVPNLIVVCREVGYVSTTEIAKVWFCGQAKAMQLPEYGYDSDKVISAISKEWKSFVFLLIRAKIGMFSLNAKMGRDTAHQLRTLLGIRMLVFVWLCLKIYWFIPSGLLKGFYWTWCILRYGIEPGAKKFHERTRQALSVKASDV